MNLVIVNLTAANQDTINQLLNELLHYPVLELDQEVANLSGQTTAQLQLKNGNEVFRQLEHDVLGAKLLERNAILSVPSHVLTRYENLKMLREVHVPVIVLQNSLDQDFAKVLRQSFGNRSMLNIANLTVQEAAQRVVDFYQAA